MNILQRIRFSISAEKENPEHGNHDNGNIFRSFLLHFRPSMVPERTLRFSLTWGLGATSAVLVFLLFTSGLALKFAYVPSPERAYDSIVYLNTQIPFGRLLRNCHRWSANGLLIVVFLHFLRVFYTAAFTAPRQLNWIVGLCLFTIVVFSNFTGYLLPWDQLAFWAITISTSMLDYIPAIGSGIREWILGGTEPGKNTLVNFYAIHTALLPALLMFFIPFHFWRIRKAHGLVIPRTPEEDPSIRGELVPAIPHLIVRDVALILLVMATVLLVSMFFDAPLTDPANPGLSPNPTKAPWYFMGIQELLMHFHPVFALLVIPALLMTGLLLIPYVSYEANTSGVWFASRQGRKMALMAVIVATLITLTAVIVDDFVIRAQQATPANLIHNGLLPFTVVLATCIGFYLWVRKAFKASNNEAIQSIFTLLISAFVVLTLIGVWFRGTGMQLIWSP